MSCRGQYHLVRTQKSQMMVFYVVLVDLRGQSLLLNDQKNGKHISIEALQVALYFCYLNDYQLK